MATCQLPRRALITLKSQTKFGRNSLTLTKADKEMLRLFKDDMILVESYWLGRDHRVCPQFVTLDTAPNHCLTPINFPAKIIYNIWIKQSGKGNKLTINKHSQCTSKALAKTFVHNAKRCKAFYVHKSSTKSENSK
jgi:hypothetical protein